MVCGCCAEERKGELFKPHRDRGCTDVLCLLLLIAAVGGLGVISYIAISAHPSLVDDLIYPTDSYGNNCGKPGSGTAELSKLFYPDLDSDIIAHADLIATGQYLTFLTSVTRLCARACPAGVSLRGPSVYGGSGYPAGANASVPEYTYSFTTQDVFGRCFPLSSTFAEATSQLCVQPACTEPTLNATLGGTVRCASLADRPEETTTWELCAAGTAAGLCAAQRSACAYSVQRAPLVAYLPEGASDGSTAATQELASQVRLLVGAADGVLEASVHVAVLGLVLPLLLGLAWALLLYLFAGVVVYLLLVLLVAFMLALSTWLASKTGWFDAEATVDWLGQLSSNVSRSDLGNLGSNLGDLGSELGSGVRLDTGTLGADAGGGELLGRALSDERIYYQLGALLSTVATVAVLLLICFWGRCIRRCIAIVQETAKVFRALPVIVAWPLPAVALQVGCVFLGLLLAMWCLDDEVWSRVAETHGVALDNTAQVAVLLYCVLVCLWLSNLCKAVAWTSMAAATAFWFVNDNAPTAASQGCCKAGSGCGRLWGATFTVVAKHLGSLAVGSFCIALCQLLRLMLLALDRATKAQQGESLVLKLAMKCAHCCMWCLQKTVEFVSYYGYVFVGLEGASFCSACKQTFLLLAAFPAQAAVNGMVKGLLLLLMGWSTPFLCAAACFFSLEADASYLAKGYQPVYAAVVVFATSFVVANGITMVFSCCIDTIYICAFKDMRENDPPKFMSNDLREAFGIDAADTERGPGTGPGYQPVRDTASVSPAPAARAGAAGVLPYVAPPTFSAAVGGVART